MKLHTSPGKIPETRNENSRRDPVLAMKVLPHVNVLLNTLHKTVADKNTKYKIS